MTDELVLTDAMKAEYPRFIKKWMDFRFHKTMDVYKAVDFINFVYSKDPEGKFPPITMDNPTNKPFVQQNDVQFVLVNTPYDAELRANKEMNTTNQWYPFQNRCYLYDADGMAQYDATEYFFKKATTEFKEYRRLMEAQPINYWISARGGAIVVRPYAYLECDKGNLPHSETRAAVEFYTDAQYCESPNGQTPERYSKYYFVHGIHFTVDLWKQFFPRDPAKPLDIKKILEISNAEQRAAVMECYKAEILTFLNPTVKDSWTQVLDSVVSYKGREGSDAVMDSLKGFHKTQDHPEKLPTLDELAHRDPDMIADIMDIDVKKINQEKQIHRCKLRNLWDEAIKNQCDLSLLSFQNPKGKVITVPESLRKYCDLIEFKLNNRPHVALRLRDHSTPKEYFFLVDDNCKTVLDALAWQFEVTKEQYLNCCAGGES